ncbi:MAG: hypothetical protein WCP21_02295 [Armatimonadota bacterium]
MAETLYTLQVSIVEGVGGDELAPADPPVVPVLEILGDQTLHQLHGGVLWALNRWDDYAELLVAEGPHDRGSVRYGPRSRFGIADPFDAGQPVGEAARTSVASLGLRAGQSFGYWFDLWDGWHHEIKVLAVSEAQPGVRYPRAIARVGDSPPQYPRVEERRVEDGAVTSLRWMRPPAGRVEPEDEAMRRTVAGPVQGWIHPLQSSHPAPSLPLITGEATADERKG